MHELVAAFESHGLPLHRTLCEMLDESPAHRTDRRGCGYTQATRFLSVRINQPRLPESTDDLDIFRDMPKDAIRSIAQRMLEGGWAHGWRRLHRLPEQLRRHDRLASPEGGLLANFAPQLQRIRGQLQLAESVLVFEMIAELVLGSEATAPAIPSMPEKPEIGSCSQAEEFFLEIAHGRVRRHGHVNLVVDDHQRPLLLEKMQLGESHSAIALEPLLDNDVLIAPGGLFALRYDEPVAMVGSTGYGALIPLRAIGEARFLRLTTLSVAPEIRRRAFSAQVEAQVHGRMLSPLTTTLADLRAFAATLLRKSA